MGNLQSVWKALRYLHCDAVITDEPATIKNADGLIVPGVGAFSPAMEALTSKGLDIAIKEFAATGKPVLGICLGMQLFLDSSEEGASEGSPIKGLGLIPGKVVKFPSDLTVDSGLKVPQIGWNSLTDVTGDLLAEGDHVYFVHSYYCIPDDPKDCAAMTEYGLKYCVSLQKGNIFATQFHPEKSGEAGLQILLKFAGRTRR